MTSREDVGPMGNGHRQAKPQNRPLAIAGWILQTVGIGIGIVAALMLIVNGIS